MSVPLAATTEQPVEIEDWLQRNKEAISELLEERWAESELGEWVSEAELLEMLAKARQERLRRAG